MYNLSRRRNSGISILPAQFLAMNANYDSITLKIGAYMNYNLVWTKIYSELPMNCGLAINAEVCIQNVLEHTAISVNLYFSILPLCSLLFHFLCSKIFFSERLVLLSLCSSDFSLKYLLF